MTEALPTRSLAPDRLSSMLFTTDQMAVLKKLGEFRGRQELFTRQTPQILETLRKVALVESTESSNRIEGITAPHSRIQDLVLQDAPPKDRPEQEIAGYRDALARVHESWEHLPLTMDVVLRLHSMLYRYTPTEGGRWKTVDNRIVEVAPDGTILRVRFQPLSAEETPEAMAALALSYQLAADRRLDPLLAIPLAILDFLCIHPFRDGNGRTARLLTLLLLYQHGYRVGRYISLERICEESKGSYYESLRASSQGWHEGEHDVMPWLGYFWGSLIRAYREFEERVGTIRTGRGSKTVQIRAAVLRRYGPFAISEIESACPGISREMIRRVLRQMRDERLVTLSGRGRAAKWCRIMESAAPPMTE